MAEERVDLTKQVYSKEEYERTIDTEFNQFGVSTVQEDLDSETTVEDFFVLYDELFYDIPAEGDNNSHEYLVRNSGEYISFDANQEEIDALRDEIATLRQENLDLERENATLLLGPSEDS